MTFQRQTVSGAAIGVGVAHDKAALSVIHEPGCAAAIWRRQMPSEIALWLRELDPHMLPSARVILRPNAVASAFDQICQMAGTPECVERDWLKEDIAAMAEMFAELFDVDYVRLRLDAVATNMCRRFHIDALRVRLVCTYRGPGTQYGISTNGEEPTRLFQVATGAPILLRGTLWPENPPSGLLHRSPPIEGSGETRLVLVLDPVFDPEDTA